MFSLLAPAYAKKYGVDEAQLKEVMTRIAWKNHKNGALNSRAQFRKEVAKDVIACSPLVAGALGIFDCSGVSDGSAAAVIVRAEDAYKYTDKPLFVKALSFIAGPAAGPIDPDYDYTTFPEAVASHPTPMPRPASRTRAPSWPWPRCTTASRPPSWC
jgi:acetyl-CoA C-acetyltransferase